MAKNAITDWSPTAASNLDVGGVPLGEGDMDVSDVNDAFREMMAQVAGITGANSLASATTTDLGSVQQTYISISGTATITSFGTVRGGTMKVLRFSDSGLTITHNPSSLTLPAGEDIVTAAGDIAAFVSEGSGNWRCVNYEANGSKIGVAQATVSTSSVSFTIPANAREVVLSLFNVSTNGTGDILLTMGDAGGIETTGYKGVVTRLGSASLATGLHPDSGFTILNNVAIVDRFSGQMRLSLLNDGSNLWSLQGAISEENAPNQFLFSGTKALSGSLTTVQISTADTFDQGQANIQIVPQN